MSKKKNKGKTPAAVAAPKVSAQDAQSVRIVSVVTVVFGLVVLMVVAMSMDSSGMAALLGLFAPMQTYTDMLLTAISGVLAVVLGFLGVRTAKAPAKVMPFYWLCLLKIAFDASDFITRLPQGVSWCNLTGIMLAAFCLFFAMRVRKRLSGK